jgi:cytochrome c peroxidase
MRISLKTEDTGLDGADQICFAAPGEAVRWMIRLALLSVSVFVMAGCKRSVSEMPVGPAVAIKVPLGLPPVPIPANNPPTAATIALGRKLFYDMRLSQDNSIACASCHSPQLDFTDGLARSRGVRGMTGVRNAPTIVNSAYLPLQFWDGRAVSLEEQAASPIANPVEMNQSHEVSVSKLAEDPGYKEMFKKAFGSEDVTFGRVQKALASFERTVLSGNSAFDRFKYGGDKDALTPAQVRGLALFIDPHKGNCAVCHTIGPKYALFTDGKFHNTGEGAGDDGVFADVGRFGETKVAAEKGAFMTPTLRNIANTAPYMHDGSLKTLKEVVDFYAGGGNSNPNLDREIHSIALSGQDRADLVEFLKSLTGEMPPNVGQPGKD